MKQEKKGIEDLSKVFRFEAPPQDSFKEPTISIDDFKDCLEPLSESITSMVRRIEDLFIESSQKEYSAIMKLLEKIINRMKAIDRRVTVLEDEIFYADEDTTLH